VAHAHHFLERLDRVTREQTEFALDLYRDHEAVAHVLQHVRLPEDAPRVALAIDDPKEGPFVIVTRDGRFVTCLGKGMRHELPVVPRSQIDALLAKVADKRARKELAQRELRVDEEEGDLFQRVVSRGSRFAREDFVALSAFEAMLGTAPYLVMLEMALEAIKLRVAMAHGVGKVVVKTTSIPAFEKLDRLEWSVAHLTVLAGTGERSTLDAVLQTAKSPLGSLTFPCSLQQGSTFFLRSAWLAGRLGKGAIPDYKAAFGNLADWMALLDAGLGLGAIGLRHASTLPDVRRILQAYEVCPEGAAEGSNERSRATVAKAVLGVLDKVDEHVDTTHKIGRDFCVTLSQRAPEGHPMRFEKPEQVPDDLARTAVLAFDGPIDVSPIQNMMLSALPVAARASGEDFYYPREIVRAWLGPWTPEESLERLKRFAEPKKEGVRAAPKPGRNDPCPCGSGKKWKKCHGGPGAPATPG